MSELKFKTYNELEISEALSDASHVIIEENGDVKRFPANSIGKVKTVNGAEPDENGNVAVEITAPVISTASVGQTIVVKSVDDTGKPTEWEAVDMVAKPPHAIIIENDGQYELAIFVDSETGKFVTESTAETVQFDPEGALLYGLSVSYQNDGVTSNLIGVEIPGDGTCLLTFWDIINNEQLRLSYDVNTKEISKYIPPES